MTQGNHSRVLSPVSLHDGLFYSAVVLKTVLIIYLFFATTAIDLLLICYCGLIVVLMMTGLLLPATDADPHVLHPDDRSTLLYRICSQPRIPSYPNSRWSRDKEWKRQRILKVLMEREVNMEAADKVSGAM